MNLSYSVDETCKITGLGRTKLYDAINNGSLPARKFGKRTIILRADLEKFLNSLSYYEQLKESQKPKSRIKKPKT